MRYLVITHARRDAHATGYAPLHHRVLPRTLTLASTLTLTLTRYALLYDHVLLYAIAISNGGMAPCAPPRSERGTGGADGRRGREVGGNVADGHGVLEVVLWALCDHNACMSCRLENKGGKEKRRTIPRSAPRLASAVSGKGRDPDQAPTHRPTGATHGPRCEPPHRAPPVAASAAAHSPPTRLRSAD